tara:strand:+ start:5305 stop:5454 length:150 start_codon:yes stop_codon:yes gene_type:complete
MDIHLLMAFGGGAAFMLFGFFGVPTTLPDPVRTISRYQILVPFRLGRGL